MARGASAATVVESGKEPVDVERFVDFARSGKPGTHAYVILLGLQKNYDAGTLLDSVAKGLPFQAFARLQRNLELSAERLQEIVQIPERTLSRRRKEGRLRPDESDRLLRAGRLFAQAIELFDGDAEAARRWLGKPQTVLGGVVPWDLARSELGAREIETAIGRIEHGVFA